MGAGRAHTLPDHRPLLPRRPPRQGPLGADPAGPPDGDRDRGRGLRRRGRARNRRDGRDLAGRPGGRYDDPEDSRDDLPLEEGFTGFGRSGTDAGGEFSFVTLKPGPVPGPDGDPRPRTSWSRVFARGLLKPLVTRIYFPDEERGQRLRSRPLVHRRPRASEDPRRPRRRRRAALRRLPTGRGQTAFFEFADDR